MAWFALSFRPPWATTHADPRFQQQSTSSQREFHQRGICIPELSADTYTVRIFDPASRPTLLRSLRNVVQSRGGIVNVELVEGRGFIFSMPFNSANPLTGYGNANLLEEGCISITKTTLAKESRRRRSSVGSSDEDEELSEGDVQDHENLRMQWRWTELKR
ncbi:hypothetical protein ACEQ8H_004942 [Pleosporales sp. CAS-2024a]